MSSLVSPIYGQLRTQIGTGPSAVVVDVLDGETYGRAKKATEHPVESGSTISDHVQDMPDTLQLVAFFGQAVDSADEQNAAAETRAEDLYQALLELQDTKNTLSVFTARREYTDMLIEKVNRPRSRADGDGVTVQIDFKQIRKATSEVVAAPPTRLRKNPKRNQGKRPKKAANESQKQKSQSILSSWTS
jgi:hypothetical protein